MSALIMALLEHIEDVIEVTDALQDADHRVLVVHSFSEAIKTLRICKVDLIISDVHLENGGNVFDFLNWTKSNPHLQETPFALLSLKPTKLAKYLADGVGIAARSLGAAKYICMDVFDPKLLREEINQILPPHVKNYSRAIFMPISQQQVDSKQKHV